MKNSILATATYTGLLLTALTVRADTPYTATGWVTTVPVLPVACTNAANQVLLRGNAQIAAIQSTDARLTGNRLVFANASFQADGTALVWGTAYQQVGTFDASTNFTPTAGLWEINYSGVMQADYSLQLSLAGYGSGGAIDGQRIVETMTRGPAYGLVDSAVSWLCTGTIKPAPLNTSVVVDNFNDNSFTGLIYGRGSIIETNQQLNVIGSFPIPTTSFGDSFVFGGPNQMFPLVNGQTREWRVDLVSLDANATNYANLFVGTPSGPGYGLHKGRDAAYLVKWSLVGGSRYSVLWCERASLPHSNVVLTLAFTRVQPDLVITARVLDKANPNTVLFQHSAVDTPGSDPTLTVGQLQALTGMRILDLVADAVEAPPTAAGALAGVFQYTDGHQPVPKAVYDNLVLGTSEVPFVGIERAVRLSWPVLGTLNYAVEGAPTIQGPWVPVQNSTIPGMNQMTVPANSPMQFFRAVQAP